MSRAKRDGTLCIGCSQSDAQKMLSTEEELKIIDAYLKNNGTNKDLARSLNLPNTTLWKIIERHNARKPKPIHSLTRSCPQCGQTITHKTVHDCRSAIVQGDVCVECGYKNRPKPTQETIRKIAETRHRKTLERYREESFIKRKKSFRSYKKRVYRMTRVIFKHRGVVCPIGYHVDHIFPIKWGFKYGVPEIIIADETNLQVITVHENLQKSSTIPTEIPDIIKPFLIAKGVI